MSENELLKTFIEDCRKKIVFEYMGKIEKCIELLSDGEIWWRVHETNNSIGNILLHLTGNIRQWVYQQFEDHEFVRTRDKEFNERTHIPKEELLRHIRSAVNDIDIILQNLPVEKLSQHYTIQKYNVKGIEVILHVTEHFSYHVGQIVFITKLKTGKDLKFYNL